jgi:hypothetical protein
MERTLLSNPVLFDPRQTMTMPGLYLVPVVRISTMPGELGSRGLKQRRIPF